MSLIQEKKYHPLSEKVVEVLSLRTQSDDPLFFRVMFGFYLAQIAGSMRVSIDTPDRGEIPVNMYALCFAPSGFGKGHSTSIVEEQVVDQFKDRFTTELFPEVAEENLAALSVKRAARKGTEENDELAKLHKEYDNAGEMPYVFDSGTTPAFKQVRHKALLAGLGSLNFVCDEIGSNLLENTDLLTAYLETFDKGKIKEKLTKNTAENKRNEQIDGAVPANLLLFGTPNKTLDGAKVEAALMSFFDTGYGRRCFFAYSAKKPTDKKLSAQELFKLLTAGNTESALSDVSDILGELADKKNVGKVLTLPDSCAIRLLEYKLACEDLSATLPEHEEIRKAELEHRYFKALKYAGALAFVDGLDTILMDHIEYALTLAEDSGAAFVERILTRERNFVKLAKYIAEVGKEVTQVDLVEDLPFYKGSEASKRELMTLAIAYGYKNNIIIRKSFNEGIEFISGEALQKTDINNMIHSFSTDFADDYYPDEEPVSFSDLHVLTQEEGLNWCTHQFKDGHRAEEDTIMGFNMLVLDVDGTATLETVQALLEDYTYHLYITKRHTEKSHRFRVVLPTNYILKMTRQEYKEFCQNFLEWLPFEVDEQAMQRSRKWASYDLGYVSNEGQLLDVLPFIPKTSRNEERKKRIGELSNLSNIERWFLDRTGEGNRNQQIIKYALMLSDTGRSLSAIQDAVLSLNDKLPDSLPEAEILSTVMVSVAKKLQEK